MTGGVIQMVACLVTLSAGLATAQEVPGDLPTPAERADYLTFTPTTAVDAFVEELAARAPGARTTRLDARTRLPVLHLPPLGASDDDPVVRVLVMAAQHGDERAGIEVALRVGRDLALGPLAALRARLDVRILPLTNPVGATNRERSAPGGIDLATDHFSQRAPETKALWREFRSWRPHVVLDLHEIGPSEYTVQIAVPTHPNVHPRVRELARFYLLPHAANGLARADVRFHEYVSPWRNEETSEVAAVPVSDSSAGAWFSPPDTDPARSWNAFALAGAVPLFVATSSSRDVLGLEERSDRLYAAVAALLRGVVAVAPSLLSELETVAGRPAGPLTLAHRYREARPDAALPWLFINDRGQREPGHLHPWRAELVVDSSSNVPLGWWVSASNGELLAAIQAHGLGSGGSAPAGAASARPNPDAVWVGSDQPDVRLLFTLLAAPWPGDRPVRVDQ